MRKVILEMEENNKYDIIKKLVDTDGNKKRAAVNLNCTTRHINRMIKGYIEQGKAYFVHGNTGKKPVHTIEEEIRQMIIDLYRTKYEGANFIHYSELLKKFDNIKVSPSTIRSILMEEFIISPKAKRNTKKDLTAKLKELKQAATSKKQTVFLQNAIMDIEDSHPRRPRCAYAGELLQMDASLHHWFGPNKSQLHIAVDDATGAIVGAYFDHQETLNGYYQILHQIISY